MHHYTNRNGFNAIRAAHPWHFKARKPRGGNPVGAYITDLPRRTPKLAKRLRIPLCQDEIRLCVRGHWRPDAAACGPWSTRFLVASRLRRGSCQASIRGAKMSMDIGGVDLRLTKMPRKAYEPR